MKLTIPFDSANDIFSPMAFEHQIGKRIIVKNMVNGTTSDATIVDACVSDDGTTADLTIEMEGEMLRPMRIIDEISYEI